MIYKRLAFLIVLLLFGRVAWSDIHLYGRAGEFSPDADYENWSPTAYLAVGRYGSAQLVLDKGSTLVCGGLATPFYDGGIGEVYVDGAQTKISVSGPFRPGYKGHGTVHVTNGAEIESGGYVYLGQNASSYGYLRVSGAGSLVSAASNYFIVSGPSSKATMVIENGGKVEVRNSATFGCVAYTTGSDGWVDVIDPDSSWELDGDLKVGRGGSGVLRIRNGALVKVGGTLYVDEYLAGRGNVYIGNSGRLAISGSASDLQGFLGLVEGSDDINYWNGTGWANITNGVEGVDYTLQAGTGELAGYAVLTVDAVGWDECLYDVPGDYNGDCKVDISDTAFLASKWLFDCSYPNKITSSDCN